VKGTSRDLAVFSHRVVFKLESVSGFLIDRSLIVIVFIPISCSILDFQLELQILLKVEIILWIPYLHFFSFSSDLPVSRYVQIRGKATKSPGVCGWFASLSNLVFPLGSFADIFPSFHSLHLHASHNIFQGSLVLFLRIEDGILFQEAAIDLHFPSSTTASHPSPKSKWPWSTYERPYHFPKATTPATHSFPAYILTLRHCSSGIGRIIPTAPSPMARTASSRLNHIPRSSSRTERSSTKHHATLQ
jgi:hypothetical protein